MGIERRQSMMVSAKGRWIEAAKPGYHQILQQAGQKNALNHNKNRWSA